MQSKYRVLRTTNMSTLLKCFLLFLWRILTIVLSKYECTDENIWIDLPSLPNRIQEVTSAIINNNLYVAGDFGYKHKTIINHTETYKYSLSLNKWSIISDRIYKSDHQSSFILNGEWWLIGGGSIETGAGQIQIYNPITDEWRITDQNGIEYPIMSWGAKSSCITIIETYIYACGGIDTLNNFGTGSVNYCAKYDTSLGGNGKWKTFTSMPYKVNHAATTCDNHGNMWIFGGRDIRNIMVDIVQMYDTKHDIWVTSKDENIKIQFPKPMPFAKAGMGHAIFYDGKFYIFGGECTSDCYWNKECMTKCPNIHTTYNNVFFEINIYDIENNQWINGGNMTNARHGIFPIVYNNAIYVAGGATSANWKARNIFNKYCLKKSRSENNNNQINEYVVEISFGKYLNNAWIVLIVILDIGLMVYNFITCYQKK